MKSKGERRPHLLRPSTLELSVPKAWLYQFVIRSGRGRALTPVAGANGTERPAMKKTLS